MDISWLYMQYQYKYCQWLTYKISLLNYVKKLSKRSKFYHTACLLFGASAVAFCVYKYCIIKEEELRRRLEEDYYDKRKLSNRRKKGLPPGLFNEGNTCFANCVLQALASSSYFVSWIREVMSSGDVSDLTVFPSVYRIMQVLTNVTGNEDTYSIGDVMSSLQSHGWVISSDQQDAYEFFQLLQATMEEEVQKTHNVDYDDCLNLRETNMFTSTILNRVSKTLPQLFSHELTSPLKGSLANKMTCITCGNQLAIKFEPFESLILSLEGISNVSVSLHSCLKKWIGTELVHDVECARCIRTCGKKYSSFTKQLSIAKLPRCLCIQLQRTYYTSTGASIKNPVHVKFSELLNLTEFTYHCISYKEKLKHSLHKQTPARLLGGSIQFNDNVESSSTPYGLYKLSSVILHFGSAEDGHFATCRRLHADSDRWIYTSDQMVKIISKDEVFLSTAYLLFYERVK